MREIKFRQAIFKDGKFHHWLYWGYVGHWNSFVAPITISQQSSPQTYEVKDSQQYIGLRCGPVSLGDRIYEGDKVQAYYTKAGYSRVYDVYYFNGAWEPFSGNCDLDHTDRYEVVGDIHQGILKIHPAGTLKEQNDS